MKRVLPCLLFWGALGLARPLCANVIYHLAILVDPDLHDSVVLVNLFPGNSSVSVINPELGRRGIFTVQQRKAIGRKIALSSSASRRLGLSTGSIAEVRIVDLALHGDTAALNLASEYQGLIASPVGTPSNSANPANNPSGHSGSFSPATPTASSTLPSTLPALQQAPLLTQTPAGDPFTTRTGPSNPVSRTDPQISSGEPTDPRQNNVPFEETPRLTSQNPAPNLKGRSAPSSEPSPAQSPKVDKPKYDIILPLAVPNARAKSMQQIVGAPSLTQKTPTQEAQEQQAMKQKEQELRQQAKPPKETLSSRGYARPLSLLDSLAEQQKLEQQKLEEQTLKTEPPARDNVVRRPPDLVLAPPQNRTANTQGDRVEEPKYSETMEEPKLTGTSQRPQIYFPIAAALNPPPKSKASELTPQLKQKPKLLDSVIPAEPVATPAKQPVPVPKATPSIIAARASQIIGNLRNINMPKGYYIQLAAFQEVLNTRQVYERFVNEYKMNIVPTQINGTEYYRCLIGNLAEGQVAEILRRVRAAGYKDAFVYQNS